MTAPQPDLQLRRIVLETPVPGILLAHMIPQVMPEPADPVIGLTTHEDQPPW